MESPISIRESQCVTYSLCLSATFRLDFIGFGFLLGYTQEMNTAKYKLFLKMDQNLKISEFDDFFLSLFISGLLTQSKSNNL
jgi:hypothetical protein